MIHLNNLNLSKRPLCAESWILALQKHTLASLCGHRSFSLDSPSMMWVVSDSLLSVWLSVPVHHFQCVHTCTCVFMYVCARACMRMCLCVSVRV